MHEKRTQIYLFINSPLLDRTLNAKCDAVGESPVRRIESTQWL